MTPTERVRGIVIADEGGAELRDDGEWRVWDRGRWRVLRLRVGRGTVRDATTTSEGER